MLVSLLFQQLWPSDSITAPQLFKQSKSLDKVTEWGRVAILTHRLAASRLGFIKLHLHLSWHAKHGVARRMPVPISGTC